MGGRVWGLNGCRSSGGWVGTTLEGLLGPRQNRPEAVASVYHGLGFGMVGFGLGIGLGNGIGTTAATPDDDSTSPPAVHSSAPRNTRPPTLAAFARVEWVGRLWRRLWGV